MLLFWQTIFLSRILNLSLGVLWYCGDEAKAQRCLARAREREKFGRQCLACTFEKRRVRFQHISSYFRFSESKVYIQYV